MLEERLHYPSVVFSINYCHIKRIKVYVAKKAWGKLYYGGMSGS